MGYPGYPRKSSAKATDRGYYNPNDNSLNIYGKKSSKDATRAKSKEEEKATGGKEDPEGSGKPLIIDIDGKQNARTQENVGLSKNSHPTVTTAGNTGEPSHSFVGTSMQGGVAGQPGAGPPGYMTQRMSLDQLLPMEAVEGFYSKITNDKYQEIERIRRHAKDKKKERYAWARIFKNQKLQHQSILEENINLRKHINKLMMAKLASNNFNNTDMLQHPSLSGIYGLHQKSSRSSLPHSPQAQRQSSLHPGNSGTKQVPSPTKIQPKNARKEDSDDEGSRHKGNDKANSNKKP